MQGRCTAGSRGRRGQEGEPATGGGLTSRTQSRTAVLDGQEGLSQGPTLPVSGKVLSFLIYLVQYQTWKWWIKAEDEPPTSFSFSPPGRGRCKAWRLWATARGQTRVTGQKPAGQVRLLPAGLDSLFSNLFWCLLFGIVYLVFERTPSLPLHKPLTFKRTHDTCPKDIKSLIAAITSYNITSSRREPLRGRIYRAYIRYII